MKTKTLKQVVIIPAAPEVVYDILLDEKILTSLHNAPATISKRAGGKFTLFNGYCEGKNLRLEKGKLIEQEWRFEEAEWPVNHFSTCTFQLRKVKQGTKLTLSQKGIPASIQPRIREGWITFYWYPMIQYVLA